MPLDPSFTPVREKQYLRRGGAWDLPALPALLAGNRAWSVHDSRVTLSSDSVDSLSRRLATFLLHRNVRRGDVVAWQMPNWHESILLFRACWHIGAIALPVHHKLQEADLIPLVELLDPKLTFGSTESALTAIRPGVTVRRPGDGAWENAIRGHEFVGPGPDPSDIALAMTTSGSTGAPKVVLHSHRALAYKASSKPVVYGLGPGDCVLVPGPLSHINGVVNSVLVPPLASTDVVLMEAWDPEKALGVVETKRVTFMGGPSTFFTTMVESDAFRPERVRSLRLAAMGGSRMSPDMIGALAEALSCAVKRTYGSTEAPSVTTAHAGDPERRGWDTDGRPSGESEIRIVDAANGSPKGPGEIGEIWVTGPELFAGYALSSQTASATRDGWFLTGDLGSLDDDGWLTVRGRIKELIIRGGENIAPAEIEAHLRAHPLVRDAVVVGVADRVLGERVAAVVVADDRFDLDQCRRWFATKRVAKFKTPEVVLQLPHIPLLATGKADRVQLLRLLSEGVGSGQASSAT